MRGLTHLLPLLLMPGLHSAPPTRWQDRDPDEDPEPERLQVDDRQPPSFEDIYPPPWETRSGPMFAPLRTLGGKADPKKKAARKRQQAARRRNR